jgi:hypothetical protein
MDGFRCDHCGYRPKVEYNAALLRAEKLARRRAKRHRNNVDELPEGSKQRPMGLMASCTLTDLADTLHKIRTGKDPRPRTPGDKSRDLKRLDYVTHKPSGKHYRIREISASGKMAWLERGKEPCRWARVSSLELRA